MKQPNKSSSTFGSIGIFQRLQYILYMGLGGTATYIVRIPLNYFTHEKMLSTASSQRLQTHVFNWEALKHYRIYGTNSTRPLLFILNSMCFIAYNNYLRKLQIKKHGERFGCSFDDKTDVGCLLRMPSFLNTSPLTLYMYNNMISCEILH